MAEQTEKAYQKQHLFQSAKAKGQYQRSHKETQADGLTTPSLPPPPPKTLGLFVTLRSDMLSCHASDLVIPPPLISPFSA